MGGWVQRWLGGGWVGRWGGTFEGGCDEVGIGTSRGEHRRQLLDARGAHIWDLVVVLGGG